MPSVASSGLRVLIVRLSALGDIIHALPVLAALRAARPDARIGWLVEPAGRPLLDGHPLLDALHVVPRRELRERPWRALRGPASELIRELRLARYDVALDLQGLTKSAFWPWMAAIPRRIGFARPDARELAAVLDTDRIRPPDGVRHIVERNLALLAPLGIARPAAVEFPVHLPAAAHARADALLGAPAPDAPPLVVLVLGAGWPTKIWPPERFGELAARLARECGCRVALAWGPGEEVLGRAALTAAGCASDAPPPEPLPATAGVWPLGPTSFLELGAVLARARLVVGGDTGPVHLAAALGAPTLGLMGPLDARRNGPYGPRCRTLQHAVPRRPPPWRNHRRWCDPATDLRRMSVDEVFAACATMLDLQT